VCFDEDLDINNIFVLSSCHHYLCCDCMTQHIVTLNKSLRASALPCPIPNCTRLVGHSGHNQEAIHPRYTIYCTKYPKPRDRRAGV